MKTILSLFTAFLAAVTLNAQTVSFKANTGDAELDVTLSDMNKEAKLDLNLFKSNMKASFSITDGKLDKMLLSMQPADVYMALEVANITQKPVEDVQKSFVKNKDKGWGVIAKEMGIKPGSKEFHALKGKAKEKKAKGKPADKGKGKPEKSESKGGGNGKGKGKGK